MFKFLIFMAKKGREHIILECTEARNLGKPVSRYMSSISKDTKDNKISKMKYNKYLKKHTLHKQIKIKK